MITAEDVHTMGDNLKDSGSFDPEVCGSSPLVENRWGVKIFHQASKDSIMNWFLCLRTSG
jgi:hypothetical protein